jgi:hypothetical protein
LRKPSARAIGVIGAALFFGGIASLLALLPAVTPFRVLSCSPIAGGTQCFGGPNLIYPAVFAISMAGAVLAFFGFLGRGFVAAWLFIVGMILLGWGSAVIIIAHLGSSCTSSFQICTTMDPNLVPFATAIVAGVILIGCNGFLRFWRGHRF